jgi:hypothetical protein
VVAPCADGEPDVDRAGLLTHVAGGPDGPLELTGPDGRTELSDAVVAVPTRYCWTRRAAGD